MLHRLIVRIRTILRLYCANYGSAPNVYTVLVCVGSPEQDISSSVSSRNPSLQSQVYPPSEFTQTCWHSLASADAHSLISAHHEMFQYTHSSLVYITVHLYFHTHTYIIYFMCSCNGRFKILSIREKYSVCENGTYY